MAQTLQAITQQQVQITIDAFPNAYWTTSSGVGVTREVTTFHDGINLRPVHLAGIQIPEEITLTKPYDVTFDGTIANSLKAWSNDKEPYTIRIQPVSNSNETTPLGNGIVCYGCVPTGYMLPDFDADQPGELATFTVNFRPSEISVV